MRLNHIINEIYCLYRGHNNGPLTIIPFPHSHRVVPLWPRGPKQIKHLTLIHNNYSLGLELKKRIHFNLQTKIEQKLMQ